MRPSVQHSNALVKQRLYPELQYAVAGERMDRLLRWLEAPEAAVTAARAVAPDAAEEAMAVAMRLAHVAELWKLRRQIQHCSCPPRT